MNKMRVQFSGTRYLCNTPFSGSRYSSFMTEANSWKQNRLSIQVKKTALLFLLPEPPKFTWTPARMSVTRLGQNKVFECRVTGTPEIDIYWFKDGSEIHPSERHRMSFMNCVASLEVCGTDTKDSGLYYCEARNEAGSESCSMELKVKGWFWLERL